MIVVNLKNYKFGKEAIELVRTIEIYCPKAIVAVPIVDIVEVVKNTNVPVYAQHVDYFESGSSTGAILPEIIDSIGARGSLLNHSEHPVSFEAIKKTIDRCHELGLNLIVCTPNITQAKRIKKLQPFAIAFEDPKLISSGKSITYYKSQEIKEFAELFKETQILPLCGAGISSGEDIKEALSLGCKGVLVSSAVANSKNPEKILKYASGLF